MKPHNLILPSHINSPLTIGLLGGSFNPAHEGHLYISEQAKKRLGLDQIWWLVSPQNPLKPKSGMAILEKRMEDALRAAGKHPFIRVTDIERKLRSNYTYSTLKSLKKRYPSIRFIWLMGADNLVQIPKWHRWQAIFHLMPIAIFARGEDTYRAMAGKAGHLFATSRIKKAEIAHLAKLKPPAWGFLPIRKHPLSATFIRKTVEKSIIN